MKRKLWQLLDKDNGKMDSEISEFHETLEGVIGMPFPRFSSFQQLSERLFIQQMLLNL